MPAVGDVLADRYRIEGVLGAGGMASVYRATDLRLDREVAVKVLLPNLARDQGFADRFDREARMLAAVSHVGIAAVYDVERGDPEAGREPFYVMELCDGGSLAERIDREGALEPGEVVPIVTAVAEGLAELHRQGLIHRDVKPANILFAGARPKLADFGLARSDDPAGLTTLTEPGVTVGTPSYLAPELLTGARATVASDVYSLGATAYHALAGRAPRIADSFEELLGPAPVLAPPPSALRPDLGSAFDAPCVAALASDPEVRPAPQAFATALTLALHRWLDEREGGGGIEAGPAAKPVAAVSPVVDVGSDTQLSIPATQVATPAARREPAFDDLDEPGAAPDHEPPPEDAGGGNTTRVPALLVALAALLSLAVLAVLVGQGGFSSGVDSTPGAGTPTAGLPSASAVPTPSVDPRALALSAVDAVVTAIEQARGGHDGLKGTSANDLLDDAAKVRRALEAGDYAAALVAADKLANRAEKVAKDLDEVRRTALLAAIDTLRATIPTG